MFYYELIICKLEFDFQEKSKFAIFLQIKELKHVFFKKKNQS